MQHDFTMEVEMQMVLGELPIYDPNMNIPP